MNVAYNTDCLAAMREMPDKAFDLAVVDPPYGIEKGFQATSRIAKYGQMDSVNDAKPQKEYFAELFRVSKNQIIWGYNHLSDMLPSTKEFVFWYKHQPVDSYSDGELAWTSFTKTAKCFDYPFFGGTGADKDGRIHPTQKPIALYTWVYQTYAKPGDKILDTHLGSGSSRIAAYDAGLDFVGYEIDKEYFDKQEERYQRHISQISLFVDGAKQEDGAITLW
jgi:site-specific DNA-methyltransferase (adenine-specific)